MGKPQNKKGGKNASGGTPNSKVKCKYLGRLNAVLGR